MSVVGAVKRAVRGRAKAVEAAKNLSSKKQLTDNIESHLSHTSLSYASDPSEIISKMRVKAPLRVPKVPKTPKQEEQQLVGRLDYLHLLYSKRVPRPAGSEVAHIKEPNLQEAVTIDVSPEKWRQREEFTKRLKDELLDKKASATVTTDSEQKQIDKLIADIKHPTEVKEPSGAQTVKEASELPEAPGTSTGTTKAAPTGEGGASTKVKDSDVQTLKTSPRRTETEQLTDGTGGGTQTADAGTETSGEGQLKDGTGNNAQTPNAGTKTPEERQTVQPGDKEPSGAPKSGGKYNPAEFMEKSKDKNLGRSERRMLERLGKMRANAQKVFEKGTDKQIKNELGRWGIETKEGARATADEYMEKIDEVLRKKAESGPTLGDKFRSHHGVGLTGLGVVGVSTLDLANSRGQQSNAQLYSDPFA